MKEEKIKSLLLGSASVFLVLFCLTPFVTMILTSLSRNPEFLAPESAFRPTLQNFRSVLTDTNLHFMDYLRNSLLIAGLSAFFGVWIAGLAAYALTRFAVRGKYVILFFALTASMFPSISLVSYLFKLMTQLGWINTLQGLVFPYIAWVLPLSLWILASYFVRIPLELDKAAWIDGCTPFQTLRRIILPVAAPGIFSVGILSFIYAFNELLFAMMLTYDHHARTVPVGITLFQGLHGQIPWGTIMAASCVTTLPVVLLAIFFQKRIVQGLTRGAVKG
ncbi:MAG TPA: carbohydrate ABC transporter permease [bacterium]|nr:carbohydrate ABC transporter permease [bacterium]